MSVARAHRGVEADVDVEATDQVDDSADQATATALSHAAIETARDEELETAADAAGPSTATTAAPATTPAQVRGRTIVLGGGIHIVGPRDSLWSIAEREYGHGEYWRTIKAANPGKVRGQSTIRDDTILEIPEVEVDTLAALKRFADQPEQLRDLVSLMSAADYDGFLAGLTTAQKEANARLLQIAEVNRATGMTIDELAAEQREFLQQRAAEQGTSVGESVGATVAAQGYGGGEAKVWNQMDSTLRKDWYQRFRDVVATIEEVAPPDIQQIIATAKSKGGGFAWAPRETEEMTAFAFTRHDWKLYCGLSFVRNAEIDPARVYANIAHEMGGHNYYGDEIGFDIQWEAMTDDERDAAERSGNSIYSTYAYPETEIFAELYEHRHDSDANATDHAFDADASGKPIKDHELRLHDVRRKLEQIKENFAPRAARGIVAGLARRVDIDPRILPETKEEFRHMVQHVFGFRP